MKAQKQYEAGQSAGQSSEKKMLGLLWDREELNRLNKEAQAIITALSVALDVLALPKAARAAHNLPRQLNSIRCRIPQLLQGVYRYKCTAATHCFMIMISSAVRDRKPYATPVQCFPYAGLNESDMRCVVSDIVREMKNVGMQVVGKIL